MAEAGESMLDEGLKYIKENKFDSSSAAVRAVMGGAEMMQSFVGMGEYILGMGRMSNDQLTKEMHRLLGKSENEDGIIDIAPEVDEDVADKSEDDNNG
jgi:hypothetical protein